MGRTPGAKNKPKGEEKSQSSQSSTIETEFIDSNTFRSGGQQSKTGEKLPDEVQQLADMSDEDLTEFFAACPLIVFNGFLIKYGKEIEGKTQFMTEDECKRWGKYACKVFRYYIKTPINPLWFLGGLTLWFGITKVDFGKIKESIKGGRKDEDSRDRGAMPELSGSGSGISGGKVEAGN